MKKVFLVPLMIVFVMRNAKQDNHGPRSSHSRFLKTQNVLNASDLMFAKKTFQRRPNGANKTQCFNGYLCFVT